MNTSPWLAQVIRSHDVHLFSENRTTDIAVVGAGISGLTTVYFLLKYTKFKVVLIEANKVAHGATGHNGGQAVSYLEQQISRLAKEYGFKQAAAAQKDIYASWDLLDEIFADTKITTPLSKVIGYAGCQDLPEVLVHLENNLYNTHTKVEVEPMVIADNWPELAKIPAKFKKLYSLVPQSQILDLLETSDPKYIALISSKKGCLNSALFCHDLLNYLHSKFADRFTLFEESPVTNVSLYASHAELKIHNHILTTSRVILCTNGFQRFSITNIAGTAINANFHHLVKGMVGYMTAFLESPIRPPAAISYLPKSVENETSVIDSPPYFYFTRRGFEIDKNQHNLVSLGGPESLMDDSNGYTQEHPYPAEAQHQLNDFFHATYKYAPAGEIDFKYKWHGLMGFTSNGLRCVGPEPLNPVLLYNLGCNGVGILTSIMGSRKIARFINGENLPKSLFDPLTYDNQ